jgi:hypothetical protein
MKCTEVQNKTKVTGQTSTEYSKERDASTIKYHITYTTGD